MLYLRENSFFLNYEMHSNIYDVDYKIVCVVCDLGPTVVFTLIFLATLTI